MKRLVALLVVLVFSCSTENIEEVETQQVKTDQNASEEKPRREITLAVPEGNYENIIEYFGALEVVEIDNGNLTHIVFEPYNDLTYRMELVDENLNLLIIKDVAFGQYWNNSEYPLVAKLPNNITFYIHFVQDQQNNPINVYVPISL